MRHETMRLILQNIYTRIFYSEKTNKWNSIEIHYSVLFLNLLNRLPYSKTVLENMCKINMLEYFEYHGISEFFRIFLNIPALLNIVTGNLSLKFSETIRYSNKIIYH